MGELPVLIDVPRTWQETPVTGVHSNDLDVQGLVSNAEQIIERACADIFIHSRGHRGARSVHQR
jgi:hypothetical protein